MGSKLTTALKLPMGFTRSLEAAYRQIWQRRCEQEIDIYINSKFKKALQHYKEGEFQQAEIICNKILGLNSNHADTLNLSGLLAHNLGKNDIAVDLINKAIQKNPEDPLYYNNLGVVFECRQNLSKAISFYQKAIDLKSDYAEAYYNMGNAFKGLNKFDKAVLFYRKSLEIKPDSVETYYNMADAFQRDGRLDEAIFAYQKALHLKPELSQACYRMGEAFQEQIKLDEAIFYYQKTLSLKPDCAEACNNMGKAFQDQGRPDKAINAYQNALRIRPDFSLAVSNLLLSIHYQISVDPLHLFEEHQRRAVQYASKISSELKAHANIFLTDRRLRVGYVSPDFRGHPVAFFVAPLLRNHDQSSFETVCYSNADKEDKVTDLLKGLADKWRNISGISDADAERMIREDGIDILVDLAGHTANNRLLLFARKPAPVQATYLGYPNTTGIRTIDYRITDAWSDPPGRTDHLYTEDLVRLSKSFLCYEPPGDAPEVLKLPAIKNGYITFGSFNNRSKITPKVIKVWSDILKSIPDARMILKSRVLSDIGTRRKLLEMFIQNGLDRKRVELFGFLASGEHFKFYNRIDIALDTFPYNGTTTTCEALWMGVPVITLKGETHFSRVGVSLLSNAGISEFIAESTDDYVKKAVQLGCKLDSLQVLRARLRSMMAQSSLMDAAGFTRSFEEAYQWMWRRRCEQ